MAKKKVINMQGIPVWGYCPQCNQSVTKTSSPKGCKYCLQELDWEEEDDSNS